MIDCILLVLLHSLVGKDKGLNCALPNLDARSDRLMQVVIVSEVKVEVLVENI